MKAFIRYLRGNRDIRRNLTLRTKRISSRDSPWDIMLSDHEVNRFMVAGIARTREDAIRLRKRYPKLTADEILKKERRLRHSSPWRRAWLRFKAIW